MGKPGQKHSNRSHDRGRFSNSNPRTHRSGAPKPRVNRNFSVDDERMRSHRKSETRVKTRGRNFPPSKERKINGTISQHHDDELVERARSLEDDGSDSTDDSDEAQHMDPSAEEMADGDISVPLVVQDFGPDSPLSSGQEFASLKDSLDPRLLRQLSFLKFKYMTKIQSEAFEVLKSGEVDGLLRSATGSGKSLAYLLPALNRLLDTERERRAELGLTPEDKKWVIDRSSGTRILVITPTRELATQIAGLAQKLTQALPWITVAAVVGGIRRKSEKASLRKGVSILVVTPGRIIDHLDTTAAFISKYLQTVVVDEADRLLDLGFEGKLRRIISELKLNLQNSKAVRLQMEAAEREIAKEDKRQRTSVMNREMLDAERKAQMVILRSMRKNAHAETPAVETPPPSMAPKSNLKRSPAVGADESHPKKKVRFSETKEGPSSPSLDVELLQEKPVIEEAQDDDDVEFNWSRNITDGAASLDKSAAKKLSPQSQDSRDSSSTRSTKGDSGDDGGFEEVPEISISPSKDSSPSLSPEKEVSAFQTVIVSATLTPSIEKLAKFALRPGAKWMKGTASAAIDESNSARRDVSDLTKEQPEMPLAADSEQDSSRFNEGRTVSWETPQQLKQAFVKLSTTKMRLMVLLSLLRIRENNKKKTLVFVNNCDAVDYLQALVQSLLWPNFPSGHKKQTMEQSAKIRDHLKKVKATAKSMVLEADDLLFDDDNDDAEVNGGSTLTAGGAQLLFSDEKVFTKTTAFRLHGSMDREDRLGNLAEFSKSKQSAVLFTTDVAARGLNLPAVDLVIQLDAPIEPADYVHRVGRTARMGKPGTSVILLLEHEVGYIQELETQIGLQSGAIKSTDEDKLLAIWKPARNAKQAATSVLPDFLNKLRPAEAVNFLLSRFSGFVDENEGLVSLALKAYDATVKGYRVYGQSLRKFFNSEKLHLGHMAGSFFIRRSPQDIAASLLRNSRSFGASSTRNPGHGAALSGPPSRENRERRFEDTRKSGFSQSRGKPDFGKKRSNFGEDNRPRRFGGGKVFGKPHGGRSQDSWRPRPQERNKFGARAGFPSRDKTRAFGKH